MEVSSEIIFGAVIASLSGAVGYGVLLARVDKIEKDLNNSRSIIERDVTSKIVDKTEEIEKEQKKLDADFTRLSNYLEGLSAKLDWLEFWATKQGYEKVPTSARFLIGPGEENT